MRRRSPRAGFSMLETVLALAVLSLAAALVTTRASQALDRIAARAAVQDFQTGLSALRAQAFGRDEDLAATPAAVPLPRGWSFRTDGALTALAGGDCRGGPVELLRDGAVRVRLQPAGGCRYARAG